MGKEKLHLSTSMYSRQYQRLWCINNNKFQLKRVAVKHPEREKEKERENLLIPHKWYSISMADLSHLIWSILKDQQKASIPAWNDCVPNFNWRNDEKKWTKWENPLWKLKREHVTPIHKDDNGIAIKTHTHTHSHTYYGCQCHCQLSNRF